MQIVIPDGILYPGSAFTPNLASNPGSIHCFGCIEQVVRQCFTGDMSHRCIGAILRTMEMLTWAAWERNEEWPGGELRQRARIFRCTAAKPRGVSDMAVVGALK
jgi:hypothetical protein